MRARHPFSVVAPLTTPPPQKHKAACVNNVTLVNALKEHANTPEGTLDRLLIPGGLSLYELDQRLEKWVQFHNYTLMGACIHALRVPEDVNNVRNSVLYVKLEPREDHGGAPAKYFRVVDAYAVSLQDAMRRPSPWPESALQLRTMQNDAEKEKKRGMVGASMIECPPLAVQTVPFGSVKDVRGDVNENWKDILVSDVEYGKKYTGFGGGR